MTAVALRLGRLGPGVPRWLGPVVFGLAAAILFVLFRGQLVLPHDNDAPLFTTIKDMRVFVEDNRNAIPILLPIRTFVGSLFLAIQGTLHTLSWPGLTAIAAALGLVIGGWRYAALGAVAIVSFGALGLWEPSVDTLALTFTAVAVALLIGIPVGILAGKSDRFYRFIMPILDLMQIMPTFAYLAPFALFFLIGPATAAILTLIYATPPAIRITALAIRAVPRTTVEAATSLGSTRRQILAKVELPMARRVMILGVNQTFMMALSMVVITVLVDAPGLGKNILRALERADVGAGFNAGLAIVIMAILFDRFTSRASAGADLSRGAPTAASERRARQRRLIALALSVVGIVAGAVLLAGADFPEVISLSFADPVNALSQWLRTNATGLTGALKDAVTYPLINPIQAVLTSAPWPLVVVVAVALALWVSGPGPALVTVVCLLGIIGLQLWEHSMVTLTTVLVATVLTLGLGVLIGILSARSNRLSQILRPFLDAAQTMPAFVYLIPVVALFDPTRFTAIVAAVVYAIPPVIRLVEAGIRNVPATVMEAATSAGATSRQLLWKVQLPIARPALLLAANQGIILVLAMVVVGGLVGAGGLGYDVVAGFARRDFFGEGFAAGIAIVMLGVMLDRITQGAGRQRVPGKFTKAEDVYDARAGAPGARA